MGWMDLWMHNRPVIAACRRADRTMKRQEADLGPTHPRIAQTLTGLANDLCGHQADPSVRRDLYLRALVILDDCVGPNATARAAVMCDIARTYEVLRGPQPSHHQAESLRWYQAAAQAARCDFGEGRVLAEAVRGVAHAAASRPSEVLNAQRMLEGILAEQELELGPDDLRLVATLRAIAATSTPEPLSADPAALSQSISVALTHLERALGIQEIALGPNDPSLVATLLQMARTHITAYVNEIGSPTVDANAGRAQLRVARDLLQRALGILDSGEDPDSTLRDTLGNLLMVEDALGHEEAAGTVSRRLDELADLAAKQWPPPADSAHLMDLSDRMLAHLSPGPAPTAAHGHPTQLGGATGLNRGPVRALARQAAYAAYGWIAWMLGIAAFLALSASMPRRW